MKISHDMDQRQKHGTTWPIILQSNIHIKESNNATVQSLNREKDFSSVIIYVDELGAPLIQILPYWIGNIDN